MPRIHPKSDVAFEALQRSQDKTAPRPLASEEGHRVLAWREPEPDYGLVIDKVLCTLRPKISAVERERGEAPGLLAELLRHPPERREVLVRNSRRFGNLSLCGLLLQMSRQEGMRDPLQGEQLARLALLLTERLGTDHGPRQLEDLRARCWMLIANARRIACDLFGAEQAFREAEAHLRRGTRDLLERAQLLVFKSSLRRAERRFSEAVRLLRRAVSIRMAIGERQGTVEALVAWAVICDQDGEPEEAIRLLHNARGFCDPDSDLEVMLRHNMALCLLDAGRTLEAKALFDSNRQLYRQIQNPLQQLRVFWVEAEIARDLGRFAEAEGLLRKIRDDFVKRENAYEAASASLELAVLYADRGRFAAAERLARQVLPVFQAYRIPREALACLILINNSSRRRRSPASDRRRRCSDRSRHRPPDRSADSGSSPSKTP